MDHSKIMLKFQHGNNVKQILGHKSGLCKNLILDLCFHLLHSNH